MAIHGPAKYAHQLLSSAIDTLATGPGDVRSRILEAYLTIHPLTPEHFPAPLREEYAWVLRQITRHGPQIDYMGRIRKGAVEVSLAHMRNSTGVKIAQKLLALHYAIDSHVNPR